MSRFRSGQSGNPMRRFQPSVSGNPGGRPKGPKTYSIRTLVADALEKVREDVIEELQARLTSSKTILPGLELAARLNKEIGSGQDGGAPVQIIIRTNVDATKLGPRGALARSRALVMDTNVDAKKL